ncbi:MAG TPA: YajQ family cyclic di-GMP-binding protein [Longimicrobiales bacterium]
MAQQNSFDVTTGADLQEVDNAVNQAQKEVATRYDFKGSPATIEFDREKSLLKLEAENDYKLAALWDVLQTKMIRRNVPIKNMKRGEEQPASGGRVRQEITLTQGIPTDVAKEIVKQIKANGFKKVQAAILGDEVRVSSPSRDELQSVMAFLRAEDFGIELNFGNYRG